MATFTAGKERVSFDDAISEYPNPRKSMSSVSSIPEEEVSVKTRRSEKKRNPSEWAILPLKVKFKTKELEKIYDRSVYRYQQELLIKACLLVIFVSVTSLCVFLGKAKVREN